MIENKSFLELKDRFKCNEEQLISYLVSLDKSRVSKGGALVERKIKELLFFGHKKEITITGLRYCDYGTGKVVGMATASKVYNLYFEEIEKHNNSIK